MLNWRRVGATMWYGTPEGAPQDPELSNVTLYVVVRQPVSGFKAYVREPTPCGNGATERIVRIAERRADAQAACEQDAQQENAR